MAIQAGPGEQYTIRRKIIKLAGAAFHVYDATGAVIGYCKQKAFRLKEDIRVYTSEDLSTELLSLRARAIVDFGATYDVSLPSGDRIGSLRRKGLKSTFVRDEWLVFDANDRQIATLRELGKFLPMLRRMVDYVAIFAPQKYELVKAGSGVGIATFRQHFNPMVYRLGVAVHAADEEMDDLFVLGMACLIAAIEGRQG